MNDKTRAKEVFLESKEFEFFSDREVWKSSMGEVITEFVEDHSLSDLMCEISRAEKIFSIKKIPFRLYSNRMA